MGVSPSLPAWMYVQHVCMVPVEPEEGVGSSGAGITDVCELPFGCHPGPLEEEPVLVGWSFNSGH